MYSLKNYEFFLKAAAVKICRANLYMISCLILFENCSPGDLIRIVRCRY